MDIMERKSDDRCENCNGIQMPDITLKMAAKKMKSEVKTESDPLTIKPTDNNNIARVKLLLQYFRALASFTQIAFFGFISFVLLLLGIIAA
jgi:hypothetical protein